MKAAILIIASLSILMFSCNDDNVNPIKDIDYTGCWSEAFKRVGYYDMIFEKQNTIEYKRYFADDCNKKQVNVIDAFIRNDTLIMSNDFIENWAYIYMDTMYYSAYYHKADTLKYVKSE